MSLETCLRKRQYPSIEKANEQGKRLGLRPYHCPDCYRWHLTSDWEGKSPEAFMPVPPKRRKPMTAVDWQRSRDRWVRKNANKM